MLEKAVQNYEKINNLSNQELVFLDLSTSGKTLGFSEARYLFIKILFSNIHTFFSFIFTGQLMKKNFINAISMWYLKNNFSRLYLFTSNNRITEMFRLISLSLKVNVVEFLHGICSDEFADYYDIINEYSFSSRSKIQYVNMLPGLPQPRAIEENLLKIDTKEVYFRNEVPWSNQKKNNLDALIIGGNDLDQDYSMSPFFKKEIDALKELTSVGYKIAYSSHPNNLNLINLIPSQVEICKTSELINSAKIIIGNFSTVIFSAHLLGKRVLVFDIAWKSIPNNLQSLFKNKNEKTYTAERVREILENQNDYFEKVDDKSYLNIMDYKKKLFNME